MAKTIPGGRVDAERGMRPRSLAPSALFSLLLGLIVSGVSPAVESNLLANGGFETAGRLSKQRLQRLADEGVRFESNDPWLPVRWNVVRQRPGP